MNNPPLGGDPTALRAAWDLDPEVTFLNHGSFGATPRIVLQTQQALREQMESQPVRFLDRELSGRIADVRAELAAFLDADASGLVFVPNVTSGVASVLGSIGLQRGDELLITDHSYNAVRLAAIRACERTGANLVVAPIDITGATAADDIAACLTPRTKLAIIDHIVSHNGLVLDAAQIVNACRARDVPIMIDGAHAPGMVDVSLRALGADLWVGNLHKWVCAPKGAAAMWVAEHLRPLIKPAITSHGAEKGFIDEFDWPGTHDPTALLAVPSALRFLASLGAADVRAYNAALAARARDVLSDALGVESPWPQERQASMVGVPLGIPLSGKADAVRLHALVYERTRIEIPFMAWSGPSVVRASAFVYNTPDQYERLALELPPILKRFLSDALMH